MYCQHKIADQNLGFLNLIFHLLSREIQCQRHRRSKGKQPGFQSRLQRNRIIDVIYHEYKSLCIWLFQSTEAFSMNFSILFNERFHFYTVICVNMNFTSYLKSCCTGATPLESKQTTKYHISINLQFLWNCLWQ